jgi:hypothetical protein
MATWSVALPPDDTVAGDPGHPALHNLITDNLVEVRANVDLALPASDSRLTAGAAGVATVRAIGATATTVVAGNDTRLTAGAAGVATVRALGTSATTAAAGNDVRLMIGTAGEVPDSTAATLPELVTDFNELLAELRARGILSA